MITRVVKLSFQPNTVPEFLALFAQKKSLLAQSEGCKSLHLFQDTNNPNLYFTISTWSSEADLERYRQSALFRELWAQVKPLFAHKAEAWSLNAQY